MSQPFFTMAPSRLPTSGNQPMRAAWLEQGQAKLLRLHGWLRPRFSGWQLNLHPHWEADRIIRKWQGSTAEHLELAYGRSYGQLEEILRTFAFSDVDSQSFWQSALISLRLDREHLHVSFNLGERAGLDTTNLCNKLQHSWSHQLILQTILSDLFLFGYRLQERLGGSGLGNGVPMAEVLRLFDQFRSTHGQIYVARPFALDDPAMATERIGLELFTQVRLLYPLYQFVCWSPVNNYL